jgi:hypothetical protein
MLLPLEKSLSKRFPENALVSGKSRLLKRFPDSAKKQKKVVCRKFPRLRMSGLFFIILWLAKVTVQNPPQLAAVCGEPI